MKYGSVSNGTRPLFWQEASEGWWMDFSLTHCKWEGMTSDLMRWKMTGLLLFPSTSNLCSVWIRRGKSHPNPCVFVLCKPQIDLCLAVPDRKWWLSSHKGYFISFVQVAKRMQIRSHTICIVKILGWILGSAKHWMLSWKTATQLPSECDITYSYCSITNKLSHLHEYQILKSNYFIMTPIQN